jgi:hypothetical protein
LVQKPGFGNICKGLRNKGITRTLDFLPGNIVFWSGNIYPPQVFVDMIQNEKEDELSEDQQKKDGYSVIVALIAVVIIGISFVWHLWSALFPAPSP